MHAKHLARFWHSALVDSMSFSGRLTFGGVRPPHPLNLGDRQWAFGDDSERGSAYVFRNVTAGSGTITQDLKLTASDGVAGDRFGHSVSQSGIIALVGARGDDSFRGSAYVFRNVTSGSGTVTQDLKLTASDGVANDQFGLSVSIDADNFVIGASGADSSRGKAYTGSVSSMSTLDAGSAIRTIDGISFISQGDWIIGQATDNNQVTLTSGNTGNVTASGKAVFIGQNAGSDNNKLTISGTMTANIVNIGTTAGNEGNTLQIDSTATFGPISFRLADDNFLSIQGDFTSTSALLTYLGSSTLQVWQGGLWTTINGGNAGSYITSNYSSGYTNIGVIPEPSTYALLALGGVALFLAIRRKKPTA